MHGLVRVSHHLYPLRDYAAQPGPTSTGIIDLVCSAPRMTLDPVLSDMELDRVARALRGMVIRGHRLLILHGCLEGECLARNDPVLLRNHV